MDTNEKIKTSIKILRDQKRKLDKNYDDKIKQKKKELNRIKKKLTKEKEKRSDQTENAAKLKARKLLDAELKKRRTEIKDLRNERLTTVNNFRKLIKKLIKTKK